ncbi:MAG: SpoIIE family protein phosphatase [Bacteroidales bacterium]|nr:SpoIIE family protein phosphatase [Bacteroidales bacterium]
MLGIIDWYTGYEISFQFFYFIPLSIIAINDKQKKRYLIIWAFLIALCWFLADYYAGHSYSSTQLRIWNTASRFIVFISFVFLVNANVKSRNRIKLINTDLLRKDKLISDSVAYATNIQNSVIPDYKRFKEFFPKSFIFSKPKDVLSGDFFWSYTKDNKITMALADCTGHGIPGALLSVVGIILLNKVVIEKSIESPAEILTELNKELVDLFSTGNELIDDGMEMCVVFYDKNTEEMTIAQTTEGAIIFDDLGNFTTVNSDIFTIGGILSKHKKVRFSNHQFKIKKGATLYLFTDGYIDQFGSTANIKYGITKFENELKSLHKLTASEQLEILSNQHQQWKGNLNQTDDITVVGINV